METRPVKTQEAGLLDGFLVRCGILYPIRRRDAAALGFVLSHMTGITSLFKG
jgi:hypothetical protein